MSGLTLLSVPIGNIDDITLRAKNKLDECSVIVAEDTRVLKDLLNRLGLRYQDKRIFSYHDHSDENSMAGILKLMQEQELVYVSDAGSPVISDPALALSKLAIENGVSLASCPGVSSVVVALELSALPATPFHFHGFLGREKSKIEDFGELMAQQYGTHVFFEGVSRVKKTVGLLAQKYAHWDFAICRELTKSFESVYRFKGVDWARVEPEVVEKGEFVVLAHNPDKKSASFGAGNAIAREILEKGAKPKLIAKLLSELTGMPSKEVYELLKR